MRWDPVMELRRMQDRLNRLLEEFEPFIPARDRPPVDIIEEDDRFRVLADLPGYSKDEIEVSTDGEYLTIRAEKKEEKEETKGNFIRKERSHQRIYRRLRIPGEIDEEGIKARYSSGVLEITIPKIRKRGKTIEVE